MTLKPDFDSLSALSSIVGLACIALGVSALMKKAEQRWVGLCRCKTPAYVLTTFVLFWSTVWLYIMPLEFVDALRPYLPFLFVIATVLICIFCKELLMCRAIGGLFVLLPTPLLSASAWHPSLWRYVMVVFAYVMIIEGMFIVGMPWTLRNQIFWLFRNKLRVKVLAYSFIVLGLLFICLAFTSYCLPTV